MRKSKQAKRVKKVKTVCSDSTFSDGHSFYYSGPLSDVVITEPVPPLMARKKRKKRKATKKRR
jgi:hypothetical protein